MAASKTQAARTECHCRRSWSVRTSFECVYLFLWASFLVAYVRWSRDASMGKLFSKDDAGEKQLEDDKMEEAVSILEDPFPSIS